MRARNSGVSAGDGRLFQNLLMTALNRTLALEQMNDVAVRVGEHLELDVTRTLDLLLYVNGIVAERRPRLTDGRARGRFDLGAIGDETQSLAATTRGRLDEDRARRCAGPPPAILRGSLLPVSVPGTMGTPAFFMSARDAILEPMARIAADGGPMNMSPSRSTRSVKSSFSARKP